MGTEVWHKNTKTNLTDVVKLIDEKQKKKTTDDEIDKNGGCAEKYLQLHLLSLIDKSRAYLAYFNKHQIIIMRINNAGSNELRGAYALYKVNSPIIIIICNYERSA